MSQELRVQNKPQSMMRLQFYQSQVRFGIQSRGAYLPDDSEQTAHNMNSSGGGGLNTGMDDSDMEDRGEDMPQYFFRPQISRPTHSIPGSIASESAFFRPITAASTGGANARNDSGVGNMVLLCNVPQDHSASFKLAGLFVLTGPSIEWVCQHNASIARLNGRPELAHVWELMGSLLAADKDILPLPGQQLWGGHPAVQAWIEATMRSYEHRGDVQTLALLSCVMSMSIAETKLHKTVAIESPLQSSPHSEPQQDRPPWMREQGTPFSAFGKRCQWGTG
ncbi:hypothetical protein DL89DRAFT_143770 [Linderina pennispora]|uniref:Uncharacterized protein n=1 Tax=Linderina pennispora TaxID=61395 RepID=A0A1Y1WCT3_9FUNG|nr:uncharacterized protein DL89DRAFT_143770 [Linderina pennispora]ORX70954.1 hypothetical protein DL89DRAFT_143770 [Linderina pennispora]